MVTLISHQRGSNALKQLQWGHVLSDMVTKYGYGSQISEIGFNGAMSFQTW